MVLTYSPANALPGGDVLLLIFELLFALFLFELALDPFEVRWYLQPKRAARTTSFFQNFSEAEAKIRWNPAEPHFAKASHRNESHRPHDHQKTDGSGKREIARDTQ